MLLLSREDIKKVFTIQDAIEADKKAFQLVVEGKCDAPLRTNIQAPKHDGCFLFMPAYVEEMDTASLKIINIFPHNIDNGIPSSPAQVLLIDGKTGVVTAVLDGTYVTQLRTGAASGAAFDVLAKKECRIGALIGTGGQAATQLEAMLAARKLEEVRVFDLNFERTKEFAAKMQEELKAYGTNIVAVESSDAAIDDADLLITVTPSSKPVFDGTKVKKGATISLCAVLAGGIGVGAYEGINYFSGAQSVQAATDSSENLTLMKSDKKSNKDSEDTEDTKSSDTKGSLDVSDVAEKAMPSVVAITTKSVQEVQDYYSMFGSQYAPSQEQEVEGSGSGIIIGKTDSELLIATNYHVVDGADTLSVAFADGNAYEATVKGFDENEDLAVVSVATKDVSDDTMDAISVAKIGSSDDLKIGEQVVAIGNALGYGQSVTTGIVSAKNRKTDASGQIEGDSTDNSSSINKGVNLIQTDAAINPGNSGGALLNMDGEVVGINSSKLASTEVEGMGYAIAISDVADSLENMMNAKARDKVDNHGILGITGSTVSTEAVQIYGIPQGVFVSEVTEGGPADDAGITKNMVITEFDGKTITSIDQLVELLQYYEPKEKIDVTVAVLDGNEYKEKTLTVKLGKDDSSSKDSKDSSEDSMSQDSQDADIPDIQGGQDDSDQGDADAFADDGEASLFRDFEQNGLYD